MSSYPWGLSHKHPGIETTGNQQVLRCKTQFHIRLDFVFLCRGGNFKICSDDDFLKVDEGKVPTLHCFSAMSNFNGRKYPLSWIQKLQSVSDSNFVLLDAASYVSTNSLDLSKVTPDFVVMSFYKMFGYPTGLGALLVRNSSSGILEKNYFGGGTVDLALVRKNKQFHRQNLSQRLEDGTADYLGSEILTHLLLKLTSVFW